jgi:penicillin-insensitive murein endopeptidase
MWIAVALLASQISGASYGQISLIGSPNAGRIQHPARLPDEGKGWLKLFLPRDRAWGSAALVRLLRGAGNEIENLFPGRSRLQVGDMSAAEGGKISGHRSHQNGLDADLAYYDLNDLEQDPQLTTGFALDMVQKGTVSPRFDLERNWHLIRILAQDPAVQRIFIDRHLISALCFYALEQTQADLALIFAKLGHFANHSDHLHVRLNCPAHQRRCVSGRPPLAPSVCRPDGAHLQELDSIGAPAP